MGNSLLYSSYEKRGISKWNNINVFMLTKILISLLLTEYNSLALIDKF